MRAARVARLLLKSPRMTAQPALYTLPAAPTGSARSYPPGTQLNWLVRYVPIKPHLTAPALGSLIEVGSGARGLASVLDSSFVGIDVRIDGRPAPSMYPFSYDGGRVPFKSSAFHTVVSMDTLEHVPPRNRGDFIQELLRIAACQVILGFPTDSGKPKGEDFMRTLFLKLGLGEPTWLTEHDEFGLPPARDVEAILDRLEDWTWRPLPAVGDLVNLLVALGDIIPGTLPTIQPVLQHHAAELEAWVSAGTFGPANRRVYLIERRQPRAPLVDLDRPASLIAAIACPNCAAEVDIVAPGIRCRSCRCAFAPDANGVFRLHQTAGPAAGTAAGPELTFTLTPDWSNRDWLVPVHNYLHAFAADDPCRLWITVDPAQRSAETALAMVRPLMLPFGDQPFPEVYLSETAVDAATRATVISLSAERARLPEYTSEWFRRHRQAGGAPPSPVRTAGAKVYW